MKNILLYLTTIGIWGSSFFAIKYQVDTGNPATSVFFRFILAAVLMLVLCITTNRQLLNFTIRQHCIIAFQGFLLFCVNFWLIYEASAFLTSGLIATVFSTIVAMNIFGSALLFKTAIDQRMVVAAILGFAGVGVIFWPEISQLHLNTDIIFGLLLSLGGTISASIGMLMSAYFQKTGLPIVSTNTIGMAHGALLAGLIAVAKNEPFSFPTNNTYVISLAFLVVFASVIAFWSFLTLIGRIGPGRASYAMVFFPLLSLLLSTLFEDYKWSLNGVLGATLVILGNTLALRLKRNM